ncbi:uncharacterized protein CC84DRAFT_1227646 [Paraphaeosphaeria sporulosa]|uniref:Uncharacterized protein n=1 Tax=Paraphaeosphaeria sporulosa TaxID=1460663 RepID=A0A177D0J1_9PLEO|nr:uncharacterized protein CC84DRAFT_1227646 [Paraphaeosphaeria sporulosa]OAG12918.1 hypothetical protein CC84DRAFT_1227646 [Paraphaeosphaeria sporulosa]
MWWESCERIHCGFWVNLGQSIQSRPALALIRVDNNRATQSTLTLPTQWGIILTAFLALFIRLAGSYLWGIICFAIHQSNASSEPQDDTYHQIQVALRNTDTEASLGWKLFRVGAVHQGSRINAFGRTSWLILLAMVHAAGIGALGGLSSRFIAGSDAVLAVKGTCGWMEEVAQNQSERLMEELKDTTKFNTFSALVVMARYGYRRSAGYARSCYAQTSDNSSNACEIYTQPTLPYNVSLSEPCPFSEKVCNGTAMTADMDGLRSDTDLGINTLPESAVTLRQTWTCVPVDAQPYATQWGDADELHMNISMDGGWNDGVPRSEKRICYKVGTDETKQTPFLFCITSNALKYGDSSYDIKSATSFVKYNGSYAPIFNPVPELDIQDADVTLMGLISRITYPEAIQDPWFTATNYGNGTNNAYKTKGWTATHPRSFLGCRQRYQLCTADRSYCSPYTGVYGIPHEDEDLKDLHPTQRAVFQLMWKMIWFTQLNFQLIFIGRENLIANDYLWDGGTQFGLSAALPPNHWQSEVTNFFNVSLAALQRAGPAFAQPPDFDIGNSNTADQNENATILRYIVRPQDAEMLRLCDSIKMRSKAHTSFTVLGLFLLIGIGLLIMLVNTILPQLAAYWQRRAGLGAYKRLEWVESGAFQLQRMAAEGVGVGPWRGKEDDVPTLAGGRGELFNLTGMSLRARGAEPGFGAHTGYAGYAGGGGNGGYHAVRSGEEMEMGVLREETKDSVASVSKKGLLGK